MDDVEGHYPNNGESNGATNMEDEMEAGNFLKGQTVCAMWNLKLGTLNSWVSPRLD